VREFFCSRCGYFLLATDASSSAEGEAARFRTICRSCRKNQIVAVDQPAHPIERARRVRAELREALRESVA
jgi:hypothetical protein